MYSVYEYELHRHNLWSHDVYVHPVHSITMSYRLFHSERFPCIHACVPQSMPSAIFASRLQRPFHRVSPSPAPFIFLSVISPADFHLRNMIHVWYSRHTIGTRILHSMLLVEIDKVRRSGPDPIRNRSMLHNEFYTKLNFVYWL